MAERTERKKIPKSKSKIYHTKKKSSFLHESRNRPGPWAEKKIRHKKKLADIRKIFKKNIQKIFKKYSKNIRKIFEKIFGPCSVLWGTQHAHGGPPLRALHRSMQAGATAPLRAYAGAHWTSVRKIFEKYSKNIRKIFGLCLVQLAA